MTETLAYIGHFFRMGGIWVWALLALNIAALAIAVERAVVLFRKNKLGQKAMAARFESAIRAGRLDEVITQADALKNESSLARVILAGTHAAKNFGGKDEIQGKMDEVLLEESGAIEARTGFLAMLSNVAMLTGLLGTITGMIKSFSAVTYANPVEKATLLSLGISEAMNCTAYGLIVAVSALIFYAIYTNRTQKLVDELNQGALKVFNWLSYAYESVPSKNVARLQQKTEHGYNAPSLNA